MIGVRHSSVREPCIACAEFGLTIVEQTGRKSHRKRTIMTAQQRATLEALFEEVRTPLRDAYALPQIPFADVVPDNGNASSRCTGVRP